MNTTQPNTLQLFYLPAINFAMQQNHVPVIRELVLTNTSDKDWENISIEITCEPEFAKPLKTHVANIAKGQSHELKALSLGVSAQYLAELSERMAGTFTVNITVGEQQFHHEQFKIDLLAYDQWNGIGLMPEMLTAFITPNHPEIPGIVRKASVILEMWTGSPSFDEYQSRNPNRVRKQMAAIYEVIAEMQAIYCSAPASFEETGQRIRLADFIFTNKLANCLDLTLLYVACLEAVGIRPFVIVVKGHAFAGAWLIDESFADAVNDDPSLITKRMAEGINEIAVVECTCMNSGKQTPFDSAVLAAEQKMMKTDEFILFVDVKRARFSGIRPLPLRLSTSSGWQIMEEAKPERNNVLPEDVMVADKLSYVSKIDVSKQRLWERKLLDLTLRNTLLNTRLTKSAIQFMTVNISALEDALANGEEFQVFPKPTDWEHSMRDTGLYQALHQTDPIADLVKHELSHKRIRTYLTEGELNAAITNVYRTSKVALEENGANTLYIGLGFLKWYETPSSEKPRYAPILLIPVEIVRKSAQKGYVIRSREEETIINITLLEMMRQDFGISLGGLETLPKDENGVDVKAVFHVIRQAVMSQNRWDVEEQAILATYSFSKFILWNDIHNNADKLCRNKVVASLVSGKLEWQPDEDTSNEQILDGQLHPADIALPISTDSSQLHAIVNSGKGKSFVLHGPPGTGKSQTITNIIANALYAGKRVLFVAAKKAALDVVESRLESIGIGSFCLELHSNKSKKSDVLAQLKAATQVINKKAPESFKQDADRLFELRNELNIYVEALHKKHSSGFSLYELFVAYNKLPKGEDKVWFNSTSVENLTNTQLVKWQDLVDEVQATGITIGHAHNHALKEFKPQSYNTQIRHDTKKLLEEFAHLVSSIRDQHQLIAKSVKLEGLIQKRSQEESFIKLLNALSGLGDVPSSMLPEDSPEQTLARVIGIAQHGKQRNILRAELLKGFQKGILTIPASQLLTEWNMAAEKWILPRWFKQNALSKNVKRFTTSGNKVSKQEITDVLERVIAYQEEQEFIDKATFLPPLLGFLWQDGEPDWDHIEKASNALIEINHMGASILGISNVKEWRNRVAAEFAEGSKAFISANKPQWDSYISLHNQLKEKETGLQQLAGIDFNNLYDNKEKWREETVVAAHNWLSHIDELRDWYNWITIKEKAIQSGLQTLISAYEQAAFESDEVIMNHQKGLYRALAEYIIASNTQLTSFNGSLFDEKIRKFREISKTFETLTRQELYAKLASKIPSFTQEAAQSSEIGILQRAIRNNGRALSIRKIFDMIPNLLPRLTPCMLMSPISVAQYFDAETEKFDLVIFDEASQMPTCEAVGAIARATNVIIVGDPKQMPPTSFFSTNNIDEENIEKEDLESILDDCLALSMPSQHLLWHYRSKHESLIAFSNAKYYDNKLLTFPSTDDINSKVRFVPVEGYYDKGKTRQNKFEAKAIVDEVVRRLTDPDIEKRSIGIVTFSSVQQILIEDMLTDVFRLRPDLEKAALETGEPLFIKNLENVQGDERDVILFSIGYGPDQDGKVSMNFGPVNRDGGWRRLNVAVSRARYEMVVFSTLKSEQIDLNRTGSEGVAGLKAFLAYAEKGRMALPVRLGAKTDDSLSIAGVIAEEIKKRGYEVHTQIGCSEYRIDIGVIDKNDPSKYILAVLTDGKNYYNAITSRDRELVQVDVLNMLGWNVHKVWSAQWWEKPQKAINGIMEAIKLAEENQLKPKPVIEKPIETPSEQQLNDIDAQHEGTFVSPMEMSSLPYEFCQLEQYTINTSDDFLLGMNRDKIRAQIMQVIEKEAPISKNLLNKRILAAWGISRQGIRLVTHLDKQYHELGIVYSVYGANRVFWKNSQQKNDWDAFRVSTNESTKRDAEDLPAEEIAIAIRDILKNQISLDTSEMIKETARIFGFARTGTNVESAIILGIDKAVESGYAMHDRDRIVYAEKS